MSEYGRDNERYQSAANRRGSTYTQRQPTREFDMPRGVDRSAPSRQGQTSQPRYWQQGTSARPAQSASSAQPSWGGQGVGRTSPSQTPAAFRASQPQPVQGAYQQGQSWQAPWKEEPWQDARQAPSSQSAQPFQDTYAQQQGQAWDSQASAWSDGRSRTAGGQSPRETYASGSVTVPLTPHQQRRAATVNPVRTSSSRKEPAPKKPRSNKARIILAVLVAMVVCVGVGFGVKFLLFSPVQETTAQQEIALTVEDKSGGGAYGSKLAGATETTDENGIVHGSINGINYTVMGRGASALQSDKVTFVGGGDQVVSDMALELADANHGDIGDGTYNFYTWYQDIAPFIQEHDLRYVDQETPFGGGTPTGWPNFNTPDSAADAINQVGFNLINFANNHVYDMGNAGVERTHEIFSQWASSMMVGGSYLTQEDRDTVHMIERNGITFAFLAYTYGDNAYGTDRYNEYRPNEYYNDVMDPDVITADVKRAQQVADVVIVSMHWGDEYVTEPSAFQLEYAQLLVDLDVDLVVGEHAHILQPIYMYTSPTGKQIPVVFGLSDLLSGWTLAETNISGLFTCDFVPSSTGVQVTNCKLYITEEYQSPSGGPVVIKFLKDLSDDELAVNTRNVDFDDLVGYVNNFFATTRYDVEVVR